MSSENNSAESNPAVFRCCQAWRNAYHEAKARRGRQKPDEEEAQNIAGQAYVQALPPLFGVRNIRNYIACVAYAAATRIIDRADSSRLLYAAQVAFSTRRIRPARQKNAAPSKKRPSGPGAPADRSSSVGWSTGAPADRSSSVGWSGAISEPFSATQEPFCAPVHAALNPAEPASYAEKSRENPHTPLPPA